MKNTVFHGHYILIILSSQEKMNVIKKMNNRPPAISFFNRKRELLTKNTLYAKIIKKFMKGFVTVDSTDGDETGNPPEVVNVNLI